MSASVSRRWQRLADDTTTLAALLRVVPVIVDEQRGCVPRLSAQSATTIRLSRRRRHRSPQWLRLETRRQSPAGFGYIVQPLRRLCQTAAATGSPVMWC
jgi:hypothetical protein